MKVLNLVFLFLLFTLFSNAQIEMNSSGEVGLGTTPQSGYALKIDGEVDFILNGSQGFQFTEGVSQYFSPKSNFGGNLGTVWKKMDHIYADIVYANQHITTSDGTLKDNFRPIDGALAKVLQINPLIYDFKPIAFQGANEDKIQELLNESTNQYGVIAQELEEIYPYLVKVDDETGLYGVNYQGLIPVIIKAMQEQQLVIDSLGSEISYLKNALNDIAEFNIKNNSTETELRQDATQFKSATLSQNIPNPVTEATVINYDLPNNIKNASITVYNVNGKQVESISLGNAKNGAVTLQAGQLKAGIYVYSLIADGVLIDTKQMIITQ